MYELLKSAVMRLLRLPSAPPEVPGDLHAHVDVFRAAPNYLKYKYFELFVGLGSLFLGYVIASVVIAVKLSGWALLLIPLLAIFFFAKAIFFYVATRLDYELRYYLVTDKSLRIREGVFELKEVTLSYVNVQNVSIEQGPVERLLGIANVIVDTAGGGAVRADRGGGGHRGALRGISNATQIRDLIRSRLAEVHHQAGLGDRDEEGHAGFGKAELEILEEILGEARSLRASVLPRRTPERAS
jgi:membrane protein YdbS with pleckstrin-like domain